MKVRNFSRLLLIVATVASFGNLLSAQGTVYFSEPVTVSTEGNHALPDMLRHVQHLYSTAVDFEQARVEYSADMRVSPVFMKSGQHPVAVRGGKLTVQLDQNDRTAYEAVQTVLAAYISSGLPGLYEAIDNGQRIDVIPVETRSATGAMRRVNPIMDLPITLDSKPRGTYQLLQDIAAAMSKASGYTVYIRAPVNESMGSVDVNTVGFSGEKARDVLAKVVSFAYQVLFDPGTKEYDVNLEPVILPEPPGAPAAPNPSPAGHPKTSPFWVKK